MAVCSMTLTAWLIIIRRGWGWGWDWQGHQCWWSRRWTDLIWCSHDVGSWCALTHWLTEPLAGSCCGLGLTVDGWAASDWRLLTQSHTGLTGSSGRSRDCLTVRLGGNAAELSSSPLALLLPRCWEWCAAVPLMMLLYCKDADSHTEEHIRIVAQQVWREEDGCGLRSSGWRLLNTISHTVCSVVMLEQQMIILLLWMSQVCVFLMLLMLLIAVEWFL